MKRFEIKAAKKYIVYGEGPEEASALLKKDGFEILRVVEVPSIDEDPARLIVDRNPARETRR